MGTCETQAIRDQSPAEFMGKLQCSGSLPNQSSFVGRDLGRRATYGVFVTVGARLAHACAAAQQAPDSLWTPLPCSQGSSTSQSPFKPFTLGYLADREPGVRDRPLFTNVRILVLYALHHQLKRG